MTVTPNFLAYLMLFGWPFVILRMLFRLPIHQAVFYAYLVSTLLLPAKFEIDLELIPPLNRDTITSLSLFTMLIMLRKKVSYFKFSLPGFLILGYIFSILLSATNNSELIQYGNFQIPGLTGYDVFSSVLRVFLFLLPFYLGWNFANDTRYNEFFLKSMVIFALWYSFPMLLELKFSPQLHRLTYGYHPSEFIQQMREGGFRPMVYIGHGLMLAFWFSTCMIAVLAFKKINLKINKFSNIKLIAFMTLMLVLCKTWSSMIYFVLAFVLINNFSAKSQVKISLLIAMTVLIYPVTKATGVFPDQQVLSFVKDYNPDRAQSLEVRLYNENILLDRAKEKPFFGWSGWGRNRVYDDFGKDLSTTDGEWIIQIGTYGIMGFLFYYGLLLIPIIKARKALDYIDDKKEKVLFSTLVLILSICIVDSIPNTGMMPVHWYLAGALLGQSERLSLLKSKRNFIKHHHKIHIND